MSLRGLFSGSKGKYKCLVCMDDPIHHTSRQQDMTNHIQSCHPLTAVAWMLRNVPESPEESGQEGDSEDKAPVDDPSNPFLESVFLGCLSQDKLKEWNMGSILCDSHEDAITKIKSFSKLPKKHFIKCFFPCSVDGSPSIAVEEYKKTFCYPTKLHTKSAIRHVILNAIELELESIVANLKAVYLVDVDFVPKYTSIPLEFKDYNDFRANIEIQNLQICECVDAIVGNEINNEDYKMFRKRLLGSKTIVDLHSMLYSPYLTPDRQQPVYFCSCRILSNYAKIDRLSFNTIIANFKKELGNLAASTSQNQMSWRDRLRNSNHQDLIHMLGTRFSLDGTKREYDDSAYSNHEFIYNSDRHINDKQMKIGTLEDMHEIMRGMFCDYPFEIWEYMHVHGLNAYFGFEEYAYGMVNLVNKMTNRSDKNFYFPLLLQALKMCCIMLAKFHNLHQKNNGGTAPFLKELEVGASEIESCIKGLQSSHKEMHHCLLIRFKAYQLTDVDRLVFKSIRIMVYALHFLDFLIGGQHSTGSCITNAFGKTQALLSDFSKSSEFQMHIPSARVQQINGTTKLPSTDDIRKISGLKFIISVGRKSSFSMKITKEINKLVGMMKE